MTPTARVAQGGGSRVATDALRGARYRSAPRTSPRPGCGSAVVAGPRTEAGRAVAGSPGGDRRDRVQVPHRDTVDGPARTFRVVEWRAQPAQDLSCRRHPGCILTALPAQADAEKDWTGSARSTRRSSAPTSSRRGLSKGAPADEPDDHALGRSRGGRTTKIHLAADGRCRPLVFIITPGQAGDTPAFTQLMAQLRVPRPIGRPRTTPKAVRADKAYSSRAIRAELRRRGIRAVIPQPGDQAAHGKRLGN